ncbi:lysylphosphatidylglycerol synthase transmembrane domain-containing protein [Actinotignum schaalii]|uniref:lysylphosphatidylglycerol synthase transmembrane domain-containing protein n=1 Tax=Actinotignum schaalii TaxID=59505 RepID=UPI00237EDDAA|nr:lysylphosphatidylglycerol synthase transmembrane domain-containing protein [Actinotignum schaalii]MDE1654751.1 lysylphosphatidylglycerol synthase transmembrane domain-containing protein [Actinotignum schaalii]
MRHNEETSPVQPAEVQPAPAAVNAPETQASAAAPALAVSAPEARAEPAVHTEPAVHRVLLVDEIARWTRRPANLLRGILFTLAIVGMLLISRFGYTTTVAVTHDVANAAPDTLRTIFSMPINVLEGLVSLFLPLLLFFDIIRYRHWRTLVTALVAMGGALAICYGSLWLFERFMPTSQITIDLSDTIQEQAAVGMLPYVSIIATILVVAASERQGRLVRTGWWALGIVLVLSVLQGAQTLTGALTTVFVGMACGYFALYAFGDSPDRATGAAVVTLIRRAGLDAHSIIRVDAGDDADMHAWSVPVTGPLGYVDTAILKELREALIGHIGQADAAFTTAASAEQEVTLPASATGADPLGEPEDDINVRALITRARHDVHPLIGDVNSRHYVVTLANGAHYVAALIDSDRAVLGRLASAWQRATLTQVTQRTGDNVEETAERTLLMEALAVHAGVAPRRDAHYAAAGASAVVAFADIEAVPLTDLEPEEISDAALDSMWATLERAHARGLTHHDIRAGVVAVRGDEALITHWRNGSFSSNELSRHIDLAQLYLLQAVAVGPERAVASALRCISRDRLSSVAPTVQRTIMPAQTLAELEDKKGVQRMREVLLEALPQDIGTATQTIQLRKFSAKTIITIVIGVLAIFILLGSINFTELQETIRSANPWWMLAAFIASFATYVGAALCLKAYTAERLPLWETSEVQIAASVLGLVMPAGIGPLALNLRYLQRNQVATPVAVATVSLVQIAQFITTVLLLLALGLLTGDFGNLSIPSTSVMLIVAAVAALGAAVYFIRPLRRKVIELVRPTIEQVWPRVVWLATHPSRILAGFSGSLLMTVSFVAAFGFSLAAFGETLPVVTLAITYLVSNSVGSLVPSPGGIGPVEAALTGGLTIAGLPYSVAFSTAILYRLLTFWARVPIGWFALRHLQKKDII